MRKDDYRQLFIQQLNEKREFEAKQSKASDSPADILRQQKIVANIAARRKKEQNRGHSGNLSLA